MPTKRRRRVRGRVQPVSAQVLHYLRTGEYGLGDHDDSGEFWDLFLLSPQQFRDLWATHRTELLAEWMRTQPAGTRPWAWWEYEAPDDQGDTETDAAFLERHGFLEARERAKLTV